MVKAVAQEARVHPATVYRKIALYEFLNGALLLVQLYGYRPRLLETVVDAQFRGTSYRAANWIYLGETRGRGLMGPLP